MPRRPSFLGLLLACGLTATPALSDATAACIAEAAATAGPGDPATTTIALTPLADDPGAQHGDRLATDLAALFGTDAALRFLTIPCPLLDTAPDDAALRRAADHGEDLAQRIGATLVIWGRLGDGTLDLHLSHPLTPVRDRFAAAPVELSLDHGAPLPALIAVDALNFSLRTQPENMPGHAPALDRIAGALNPTAVPPPDMPPRLRAQRLDAAGRLVWMTAVAHRTHAPMTQAADLLEAAQALYADLADGNATARMANDRGLILQFLAQETGDTGQLQAAVAAFRAALASVDRDARPANWAQTQSNLGQTLHTLGESLRDPAAVAGALTAYRAAMEVWTEDEAPFDWSRTQTRRGNALVTLVDLGGDPSLLDQAVDHLNAALAVQEGEPTPAGRAETRTVLGHALTGIGWERESADHLAQAVAVYRLALEDTPRDLDRARWGLIQHRMGFALHGLGAMTENLSLLDAAAAAQRAALDAWPADGMPLHRLRALVFMSDVLWDMADATGDPAYLIQTAEALTAALDLMPDGYLPEATGIMHSDLALLLALLWYADEGGDDDTRLLAAEGHAETAVQMLTPFGASPDLDRARDRLQAIREELGR